MENNYENLSDEKLIELYKNGDELALNFLFTKYKPLASKISRSYFLIGAESEDLLQEAMIGLLDACRKYDKMAGSSFKTFATLCVSRAVQSAVKTANRLKNKALNDSYSLSSQGAIVIDSNISENDSGAYFYIPSNEKSPLTEMIEKERNEQIKKIIDENLSKKEKRVLALYLEGLSYREISLKLNEPIKVVDNAIFRTKKKMEELLN